MQTLPTSDIPDIFQLYYLFLKCYNSILLFIYLIIKIRPLQKYILLHK